MENVTKVLKSFDIEFQPFIEEINAKEGVIREYADAATMERVRSKQNSVSLLVTIWCIHGALLAVVFESFHVLFGRTGPNINIPFHYKVRYAKPK